MAAPSAAQTERCGVVVRTERGSYDDGHGGSYTADTVTILSTDGSTYSYPWTANYLEAGDPVGISIGSDGKVTLKRLSSPALSGKVSADGLKLGTHTIAPDAEILDAAGGNAVKIFPSRLAGMELTSGKVAYYSLNGSGEIDRMVLNNATGDAYRYGVLTHMESFGEGLYASYSYEYDVGGTSYSIPPPAPAIRCRPGPSWWTATPLTPTAFSPSPPSRPTRSAAASWCPAAVSTVWPTRSSSMSGGTGTTSCPPWTGSRSWACPSPAGMTGRRTRAAASESSWPSDSSLTNSARRGSHASAPRAVLI